ncbi:translation machinery-associated [Fusarium longipes]|uniref:Translation machinery-associated n=1 Tax=Fusarium longipes TaxID=694270 RepID=A0A395T0H8_9HYPO|nr:translation machinery-associated [Fusarium longipes]
MTLVVPGINSTSGDKVEEWQNKLIGKKLSDDEASDRLMFWKEDRKETGRLNRTLSSTIAVSGRSLVTIKTWRREDVSHMVGFIRIG